MSSNLSVISFEASLLEYCNWSFDGMWTDMHEYGYDVSSADSTMKILH